MFLFAKEQKKFQVLRWCAMVYMAKKLLHRCTGVRMQVYVHFWWWVWHAINLCYRLEHQCVCRCTLYRYFWHQDTYLQTHSLSSRVCTCASAYAVCWLALGDEGGEVWLMQGTCSWRGTILLTWKQIGVLPAFSLFFDAGVSVCGCMCVYTHTHTHTLHVGCSDMGPGIGTTHLKSPKNPYGLNLDIYVFVCVQSTHVYIYAERRDEILD